MKNYWLKLDQKFLSLTTREKTLLTVCAFVVVVMALYLLLLEPMGMQKSRLQRQLQQITHENIELEGQISVLSSQLKQDPDKDINLEFNQLITESQALSKQLSGLVDNLISPAQMTNLLELVLRKSQGLKLVALESLPPESITATDGTAQNSGYYVHPVRIELTGDYFAIAKYLSELEQMPVKYYWRSFKYDVEKHPRARLVLEVYTLGSRKEFIGG